MKYLLGRRSPLTERHAINIGRNMAHAFFFTQPRLLCGRAFCTLKKQYIYPIYDKSIALRQLTAMEDNDNVLSIPPLAGGCVLLLSGVIGWIAAQTTPLDQYMVRCLTSALCDAA